MDFALTDRCREYQERLLAFMDSHIYPNESVYEEQLAAAGDPHAHPPIMEELKAEAKRRGLWNLFHPHEEWGPGLANAEYAPLAEIMGHSPIGSETCNCSAPDTGNMEVLTMFGTPAQQQQWLRPLLDGEMRSAFGMTEPDVASSDATNIALRIERQGDYYVLNGRKWWTSNIYHPNCKIMITMGKTDLSAPTHRQQSMVLVPVDAPGVTVKRNLTVFDYIDQEGHGEVVYDNVRVPVANLIGNEAGPVYCVLRRGPRVQGDDRPPARRRLVWRPRRLRLPATRPVAGRRGVVPTRWLGPVPVGTTPRSHTGGTAAGLQRQLELVSMPIDSA